MADRHDRVTAAKDVLPSVAGHARQRRANALPFESLVERRIRQAQEQGIFDNLSGQGRPLDLEDNPFEDPDWRVSYRILKNAGFAPRWIELGRELEADWQLCEEYVAAYERGARAAAAALAARRAAVATELAAQRTRHEQFVAATMDRVRAYNEKVALYNLAVPIFGLQRWPQPLGAVLERLAALDPGRLYAAHEAGGRPASPPATSGAHVSRRVSRL